MNTEKAVDLLDNLIGMVDDNQGNDYDSAFHMAIDALKAQSDGDTISRKAAIDAISCNIIVTGKQNAELVAATIGTFADRIKALPPVQPKKRTEERTETHACDLISRQAAIDALDNLDYMPGEWSVRGLSLCKDTIKALPPAQPEVLACGEGELIAQLGIVRCKDCEYGEQDEYGRWYCRSFGCQVGDEDGNGFCSDAERRTDG